MKNEKAKVIKAYKDISEGKIPGVKIHQTRVFKCGSITLID